jgi:hypothetical protein
MNKKCTKCNIEKEITEFHKQKSSKDGLYPQCKECYNFWKRTRYPNDKIKYSETRKKWNFENKLKTTIWYKQYSSNPEIKKRNALYWKNYYSNPINKEKHLQRTRNYNKEYITRDYVKERKRIREHNRRTNLLNSSKLTQEKLDALYANYLLNDSEVICICCFEPILLGQEEIEHNIPVSRYHEFLKVDLNDLSNLAFAHAINSKEKCNLRKSNQTLSEWYSKNPSYLVKGVLTGWISTKSIQRI